MDEVISSFHLLKTKKMKIKEIIEFAEKPELYEKGTAVMWTDPHISKQLLEVHLNPEIDLATRKYSTVQRTAEWVLKRAKKEQMNILDLGCGPGIYTEIFAKNGHYVTGVDFSKNSINYASGEAKKKGLDISYLNQNYLELEVPENHYDLVTLIFTDLGVLSPDERDRLIQNIKKALKPGGLFIFDLLNDKNLESKVSPKHWEIQEKGFWKDTPYLALSESILYKEEKVILSQHTVLDEFDEVKIYRFWTHFFAQKDIKTMLQKHDFTQMTFHENVLPESDNWNGDNVTFTVTIKN